MSEEDKSSKTEEPTEKKLRDARKKGDVPQSRETGTAMVVFALLMIFVFVLPSVSGPIISALQNPLLNAADTRIGTDGAGLADAGGVLQGLASTLGLSLAPHAVQPVAFAEEDETGSAKPIVIMLYSSAWDGSPVAALEGGEIAWFRPHEIDLLPKPPLDIELSRRLFEKG